MAPWLAHRDGERQHLLTDHLEGTAERASRNAEAFDSAAAARVAGWLHDLGKAQDPFQRRLRGDPRRVEHSIHGALRIRELARSRPRAEGLVADILAAVIAGHHSGLPNARASEPGDRPSRSLRERLAGAVETEVAPMVASLGDALPALELPPLPPFLRGRSSRPRSERERQVRRLELWQRMLFSALVDADFLDTEAFYRGGERERLVRSFAAVPELRQRLDRHVDALATAATASGPASKVNRLRAEILEACRSAASGPPGVFSLTVPTGGGKTLAGMSFALRHAEAHGLRRVVVAIPFTSILEQNADVYAEALGRENVIEHHSAFEPRSLGEETDELRRRHELAAENWDAPVVVTTNVQLFESLFANRPSRCRKLHNLARSVILLDEAQTVPPELLAPILEVLQDLVENYGVSVVLATATPPAFARRPGRNLGLPEVREIVSDRGALARDLLRYRVEWRHEAPVDWPDLARELAELEQVLCIVHRRDDAVHLARALAELTGDVFHLSAGMCGAHRSERLDEVRERLRRGLPCRLVSTQLIEAGVDVDFPVVFRALGGMESLVQAAGRCNREGELPYGRFVVFRAPSKPPLGTPRQGLDVLEGLLRTRTGPFELHDPEEILGYFAKLYGLRQTDKEVIQAARTGHSFATVDRRFRMIDDTWSTPLAVHWGESPALLDALEQRPQDRDLWRALQRYTVNAPTRHVEAWRSQGVVETLHERLSVEVESSAVKLYVDLFGLTGSEDIDVRPTALFI